MEINFNRFTIEKKNILKKKPSLVFHWSKFKNYKDLCTGSLHNAPKVLYLKNNDAVKNLSGKSVLLIDILTT